MIDYRVLSTMEECRQLADLEMLVWNAPLREALVPATVKVIVRTGGLALGAYDGDTMVGFSISPIGLQDGEPFLWSHITGTHPDYRRRGIGIRLKEVQRDWALARGYRTVRWTFDPLRSQNAHFNYNMIGAVAGLYVDSYYRNLYGAMTDGINKGIPTDRFEAVWVLDAPANSHDAGTITTAPYLVRENSDTLAPIVQLVGVTWDAPAYRVAVPSNLDALRPHGIDTIRAWREAHRATFEPAFTHGYAVTGFDRQSSGGAYLLTRR